MMLSAKDITKTYRQGRTDVRALKGASLEVRPGERIYVHGPSGAGKSTLLHALGGLERPTSGKVLFKGRDIYRLSGAARSKLRNRSFGFVFQMYYLLPEFSVLENVMMPALIKGEWAGGALRSRAEGLLGAVGLEARGRHRPGELSGGEAQRTAIARALINSPDVLFCDEPAGNLDSGSADTIYSLMSDLSEKRGMSVVVISHQDVRKDFYHTEYMMKDGLLTGPDGSFTGRLSVKTEAVKK
ncbi:MAG: ABC transporter ATP-binding protein [Candidatus Omnitrophica bacterium]|nr:ABC transporter ATP-binding protein [Candidatus Omnitrophota bacterium]